MNRISDNIGTTVVDYDVTGAANGNAFSLAGNVALLIVLVVNTAAASGITVQWEAYDGTSSANLGTAQVFGASLTSQAYPFDFYPADVTNALSTATSVRAVYSSASGTVRVDAIGEYLPVGRPPTWTNPPVYVGHTM